MNNYIMITTFMNLLKTSFNYYRTTNNIKIPYHLQWETRDFYVKNINKVPYDKQWETRDFYRKKK